MKRLFALLVFLMTCAAGAAAAWAYLGTRQPYRGFGGEDVFVDIRTGTGTRAIGERLVAAGVVRDRLTFRAALWMSGRAARLQAGEYRFTDPATPLEVISRLARGDVFVIPVTIPEGLTLREVATIVEARGFGAADAFVRAAGDATLVHALDPAARDLEGYLFPETYPLSRNADAPHIVRLMTDAFDRALSPDLRTAAAARGLSVRQLVTLASIVEKETGKPDERPIVASVYENRLRIGMLLQCDPTVIYALQKAGRYDGNLHRGDLSFDSPYNTYRYPGLPPGPIAAPGRASLEAVVHPAETEFLYFVSRNDGSHEFAATLDEHNRNVQKYQIDYFKARRAEKAGRPGQAGKSRLARGAGRAG